MMRQLAWKECREGARIWAMMFLLGAAAIFVVPPYAEALDPSSSPWSLQTVVSVVLFVLCSAYGVVAGAMMLAGEREGGTLDFLDHLSPRRRDIWQRKLLIGAGLALSQGVLLAVLNGVFGPAQGSDLAVTAALPLVSLDGLIWGLLGAALCRTVLTATFVVSMFGMGVWTLTVGAGLACGPWVALLLRILLDAGVLVFSARIFCEEDRDRRATSPAKTAQTRLGAIRAAYWLAWRQGRTEWLWLAGLAFGVSLLGGGQVVLLWPGLTLLLGALNGTRVWAEEQSDGTRRFLADQRLPLSAIWLGKTFLALANLVAQMGLLVLIPFITEEMRSLVDPEKSKIRLEDGYVGDNPMAISFWGLILVFAVTGFAAGQLFGVLNRKRIIAVILALVFGGILAAFWLPSLAAGGLTFWHVLVGPALLLLAVRLVLPAWSADRLGGLRAVLTVAACVVLAIGWEAGCLAWRVLGVRDVGEPFDVAACQAELSNLGKAESAELIRAALAKMAERLKEAGEIEPQPPSRNSTDYQVIHSVLQTGWGEAPAKMGPWLDRLFDGNWPALLHRAVALPPGVVENQRAFSLWRSGPQVRETLHAAQFLTLRAYQLQTRGKDEPALELLLDALALSRQLRPGASFASYGDCRGMEHTAAAGIAHWAGGSRTPALLRRALTEVERHEKVLPPFGDVLKMEFIDARARYFELRHLDERFSRKKENRRLTANMWRAIADLLIMGEFLPWERARTERLMCYRFGRALKTVEADPRLDEQQQGSVLGEWHGWSRPMKTEDSDKQGLRVLRLQLALVLFQREKGRAARSLNELVPDILPALPADPSTGGSFGYRLANESDGPEIVPGQGIIRTATGGQTVGLVPRLR